MPGVVKIPLLEVLSEDEWIEEALYQEWPNALVDKLLAMNAADNLEEARGFYYVMSISYPFFTNEVETVEVAWAKIMPLLVKFRNTGADRSDGDAFKEVLEKYMQGRVPEESPPQEKELPQLPSLVIPDVTVGEIELTAFFQDGGLIYDQRTGRAITLSAQVRQGEVSIKVVPEILAAMVVALLQSAENILASDSRLVLVSDATARELKYPSRRSDSPSPTQQKASSPPKSSHTPPPASGNAKPKGNAPPTTKGAAPMPGKKKEQAEKAIPAMVKTIDPDQVEPLDYDAITEMISDVKVPQGHELIACYAIKRIKGKKDGVVLLTYDDQGALVEAHKEWNNADPEDPKTNFKNPFWKLDQGARQNGVLIKDCFMGAIWKLDANEVLYFPYPLLITIKVNGDYRNIDQRVNTIPTWRGEPYYE